MPAMRGGLLALLPAAAEGFVELHEALIFGAARLRQSDFCFKERALTVQHFQISGRAASVTHDGEANRLRQVCDGLLLANAHFMEFLISDQPVGHIAECELNRLFVSGQRLLVLSFGHVQIPAQGTAGENGLAYRDAVRPDAGLRAHQAREKIAASECAAACAGQRNLWEELRFGHANFGILRNQDLLSLTNVGPALEQRGREAWRHARWKHLVREHVPAWDAPG